jgi:hypothetical protein
MDEYPDAPCLFMMSPKVIQPGFSRGQSELSPKRECGELSEFKCGGAESPTR